MTITIQQGGAGPSSPLPVPLGATTVSSVNPNNFAVFLKISPGTATITNITIGGASQGAVVAGKFLVPANGTVNITYSGTPNLSTFSTGLTPPTSYPFTEPIYGQAFTPQQFLQVPGVNPWFTDA